MKTKLIGAFAPVTWTDPTGGDETVIFVIGDSEAELDSNANDIHDSYHVSTDLECFTVVEVTHAQWWDVKHGTNISLGFYINDPSKIAQIEIPTEEKW